MRRSGEGMGGEGRYGEERGAGGEGEGWGRVGNKTKKPTNNKCAC